MKFHWKPVAGVHSLVWEEAQIAAGVDPDFHRRDMADAHRGRRVPGVGTRHPGHARRRHRHLRGHRPARPDEDRAGGTGPVQLVGKLTLNRNPTNYFAETEQVAFHTGNLVPGIEVTNDPLMQARLFSYLDTQLTRLGGPNFTQLPINRPHCPVNDMLRDGMHQTAVHTGLAPYRPNSLDDGGPSGRVGRTRAATCRRPRPIEGTAVRANPVSFDDHFTQPAMFYRSLTEVERAHIVEAFTFELGKCYEQAVKERELAVLADVDADLCAQVAAGLGLPAPKGSPAAGRPDLTGAVPGGHRTGPDRGPPDRRDRGRRGGPRPVSRKLRKAVEKLGASCWSSLRSAACSSGAGRSRSSTEPC